MAISFGLMKQKIYQIMMPVVKLLIYRSNKVKIFILFFLIALFPSILFSQEYSGTYILEGYDNPKSRPKGYVRDSSSGGVFQDLIIEINIDKNDDISGVIKPKKFRKGKIVTIKGKLESSNVMTLSFDDDISKKMIFQKHVNKGMLIWVTKKEDWKDHFYEHIAFYKHIDSNFSEVALTTAMNGCSPLANISSAAFKIDKEQLNNDNKLDKNILEMEVYTTKNILKKELENFVANGCLEGGHDCEYYINIPVGTLAYIIQSMRKTGWFKYVEAGLGGCAGAEESFLIVKKSDIMDNNTVSKDKFISYLTKLLNKFLKDTKYKIQEIDIKVSKIPPHPVIYRVRVTGKSEIFLGKKGYWNLFDITFKPTELESNSDNEYSILVTIDRLRESKRSYGNEQPPSESWFTTYLSYEEEGIVAEKLRIALSDSEDKCIYSLHEGYCQAPHVLTGLYYFKSFIPVEQSNDED